MGHTQRRPWLVAGLALLVGLSAAPALDARDRRNDNDRQQRQRHDEREAFWYALTYQQALQYQYMTQQYATLRYMQALPYMQAARSGYFVDPPRAVPGAPAPAVAAPAPVARPLSFRELPGERELDLGKLYAGTHPEKARVLFEEAIRQAGPASEIAAQARKELMNLPPN
jgi:hypothetical protein